MNAFRNGAKDTMLQIRPEKCVVVACHLKKDSRMGLNIVGYRECYFLFSMLPLYNEDNRLELFST